METLFVFCQMEREFSNLLGRTSGYIALYVSQNLGSQKCISELFLTEPNNCLRTYNFTELPGEGVF
jgi:hypothetical protein